MFYESLDETLKTTEGTLVSQILLCISLYMNREYQASKDKLILLKDLIGNTNNIFFIYCKIKWFSILEKTPLSEKSGEYSDKF